MQAGADFFFHVSCAKKLQGQCRRTIVGLVFRDDPWIEDVADHSLKASNLRTILDREKYKETL